MKAEPSIVCVDCGGTAYLLSFPPEDGEFEPGDIVAYRCRDCLDRWDLVLPDDNNNDDDDDDDDEEDGDRGDLDGFD
jgi:hypothetical protein